MEPDSQKSNHFYRQGPWFISVETSVHSLRDLRAMLVDMAYTAKDDPDQKMLGVLVATKLTKERIRTEQQLFANLIGPVLAAKIKLTSSDDLTDLPSDISIDLISKFIQKDIAKTSNNRGSSKTIILDVLINNWLKRLGPQTAESVCRASGASFPTVSALVKELNAVGLIKKETDRRFDLKRFPLEQFKRSLIVPRKAAYFIDPTNHPRSPEKLLSRFLGRAKMEDIAISGYHGARHHYPLIDLTGGTRVDLVMRGSEQSDLSFVQKIDSSLLRTNDPLVRPNVVVHFERTMNFENDESGISWADPLTCLRDLYEMRLDAQADEMLTALVRERNS